MPLPSPVPVLLLLGLAFGHGGEQHGPAVAPAPSGESIRVHASTPRVDAVLRLPATWPGELPAALLVADAETSAPADLRAATLSLSGPVSVEATLAATSSGVAEGTLNLGMAGDYAGSAVVQVGERAELLAISGLHIEAPAGDAHARGLSWGLAAAGGLLLLVVGLVVGRLLGRRAGLAVGALLAGLSMRSAVVGAHGGEDHGAPADSRTHAGGALTLPMESQFLVGLRTTKVFESSFQERVAAFGALQAAPGGAATLASPVAGLLSAPPGGFPRPGDQVQAGDVVGTIQEVPASLDRAELLAGRAEAAARLEEARAALALAERDAARSDALGGAISERERLERQGRLDAARAAAEQTAAALAAFEGARAVTLRAPISGRVAGVTARPGDTVEEGQVLLRVVGDAALWMSARVPEREALSLRAGAEAQVSVPAAPGRLLPAVVLDPGLEADPLTGTVEVTLALDADDLKPGLSATAWIAAGEARPALVVPDAAVVESEGVALAFVKTGPETFEARELHLGARSGGSWEVLAGLRPGERVVTQATGSLRSLAGR